jgi:hypothetical protein
LVIIEKAKINIQISTGFLLEIGLNGINSNAYVSNFVLIMDTRANLNDRKRCWDQYIKKRRSRTVLFQLEYLLELTEYAQIYGHILVNLFRGILFYPHGYILSLPDCCRRLPVSIESRMIDVNSMHNIVNLVTKGYKIELTVRKK